MKRCLFLLTVLTIVLIGVGRAELIPGTRMPVDYCKEYITLRDYPNTRASALERIPLGEWVIYNGPSWDGFTEVTWRDRTGYVLTRYLNFTRANDDRADDLSGVPVKPTAQEYYNINLFLSNFAEQCWNWTRGYIDEDATDEALVGFAIDHIWLNQKNKLEWGNWGYDNVRLSDQYIAAVTRKYLGKVPRDLSRSQYATHRQGYYYWQETGRHTSDGFAILDRVERLESDRCFVRFNVVDPGTEWSNDVCRCTLSEALERFEHGMIIFTGSAIIDCGTGGLSDRSTWRLERWAVGRRNT